MTNGCPDIPVVIGEIAQWHKNAGEFNTVLNGIPGKVENCTCVSSEVCGMLKDASDPHFSRDGQNLMGKRYAEAMKNSVRSVKNYYLCSPAGVSCFSDEMVNTGSFMNF